MEKVIQRPLKRVEINKILQFLSYHLNYKPPHKLNMIFAKTPAAFARIHDDGKAADPDAMDEINRTCPAFFDHSTMTAVFQGFSYVNGITVPYFILPMATVIHECIHFYQYSTGPYGSWKTMYEGTNELLSCFLTDDYSFDYHEDAKYAFNLAMAINGDEVSEAINWMKRYTTHSDKNKFVSRSILTCATFSKFRPSNLMRWLDADQLHKIKNDEVRAILTKYSEGQLINLLRNYRSLVL
jgi:hypothetical protein